MNSHGSIAALAAIILLAGCSSSPEPAEPPQSTASVVVLPEPQPQRPAQPPATPSTAASASTPVVSTRDAEPEPPEAQTICDIDPEVCKEPDPKTVAKCGCNRLVGRERAKCIIDCVARERNKLDQKTRQP